MRIESGVATRGLLIRHLVLPGRLAGTERVIAWIKAELGVQTALSLMAQYQPLYRAADHPMLMRTITGDEYEKLLDLLLDQGFENVFIQELESAPLFVPDFTTRGTVRYKGGQVKRHWLRDTKCYKLQTRTCYRFLQNL